MWISVEDKLPNIDDWVLIPNSKLEYEFEPASTLAQYRGCFHKDRCCEPTFYCVEANGCVPYIDGCEVTHWMPLPEPPKGD